MQKNVKTYIVKTPGVMGGRPRIAGHRIRVQADGLRLREIPVTRAQEVGLRRASDDEHFAFARRENYAIVTKEMK